MLAGRKVRTGTSGLETVLIWDAGVTGIKLTCYKTAQAPLLSFLANCMEISILCMSFISLLLNKYLSTPYHLPVCFVRECKQSYKKNQIPVFYLKFSSFKVECLLYNTHLVTLPVWFNIISFILIFSRMCLWLQHICYCHLLQIHYDTIVSQNHGVSDDEHCIFSSAHYHQD